MSIETDDICLFVQELAERVNTSLPQGFGEFRPIAASTPQYFRLSRKREFRPAHFLFIDRTTGDAFKAKTANRPSDECVGNFLNGRAALLEAAVKLGKAGMFRVDVAV